MKTMPRKITSKTLWRDLEPWVDCLSAETIATVEQRAIEMYSGGRSFYDLRVVAFLDYLDGDVSAVGIHGEATAFEHFYISRLAAFTDEFSRMLERLTLPPTSDETSAGAGSVPMTFAESTLVFLRSYFNLPNFAAAGALTLQDWMIAKHDVYNTQLFQRRYNEIQKNKMKKR